MNVVIRPTEINDIPELLRLVEEYWRFEDISGFDPAQVTIQLERLLADPALGGCWLASTGRDAAGYLLAVYVFSLEHLGLTAEIDEFFVLPSFRGRDLGSRLLKIAEEEFVRRRCTNVSLQLGRGNDNARTFYRQHGYGDRAGYHLLDKMLPRG
jgi:GNAT superfamily N-acetyltransferase